MSDQSWTDADTAQFAHWSLPEGHPSRVVSAFFDRLSEEEIDTATLRALVTPESISDWGDFSVARDFADEGYALANRALRPRGSDDVALVKLIADQGAMTSEKPLEAKAYVTLVWRPSAGGWLIHGIGGPIEPERLPRERHNGAPTYDNDSPVSFD